jgi:hypothetical protein
MQQAEGDNGNDSEEEETKHPVDCCLCCILSLQEDFQGEKSLLKKVSKITADHFPHFSDGYRHRGCLPFSAQVSPQNENPIEYYWG